MICEEPTARYPQGRIGTDAGYQAHRGVNEQACEQCQAAHVAKCRARWSGLTSEERERKRLDNRAERARYAANRPDSIVDAKRRFMRANRAVAREAKSRPCADCGVAYPYYVMQFDHLGDKSFNIGTRGATGGRARLAAEIAKCQVVCANCHAERTFQRLQEKGRVDDAS